MNRHLCCLLVVLCIGAFAVGQEPVQPRHLPGGGVGEPAGKTGFFPNSTGGIDAIELATGKLLWSSKDANRPLLATADRLFAQKQNAIFVLDTAQDGKLIVEAKPIPFPSWAAVEIAYGRTYRGSTRLEGGALLVSWEARAFYSGGARPTPAIEKAARKEASGVARVELQSGKIEPLDADQIAAGRFFPMPAAVVHAKAGALTLTITDGPAKNAKNPFQQRRTLQGVNESKEVVWQRDIAAPVFLLPRP